jgi:hypothetical protein
MLFSFQGSRTVTTVTGHPTLISTFAASDVAEALTRAHRAPLT